MFRVLPPTRVRCGWLNFRYGYLLLCCGLVSATLLRAQLPPELARLQAELRRLMEQASDEASDEEAKAKVGGKWRGVSRIKGTASIYSRSVINEHDEGAESAESSLSEEEVAVRFELERETHPGVGGLFWRAREVTLAGGKSSSATLVTPHRSTYSKSEGRFRGPPPPEVLEGMRLTLNTENGRWEITTPAYTQEKYTVTYSHVGRLFASARWEDISETNTEADNRVQNVVFSGTIGDQPAVTVGSYHDEGFLAERPTRPYLKRGRIEFWPEFDDYELEVTIDDYAKWRPLGLVETPDKPGNHLTAKATVITKGGGEPAQVKAIRFALVDVSREPGVCLNWPLGAKDSNPDLKLAAAPECPGAVSQGDQRLEVTTPLTDDRRRPYALAQIDSYDFGGRATLRVTCELVDGRELVGELKGEGGKSAQDLIRLPKMNGPGWIAEAWKKEKKVESLADNNDSEKVEGQQYEGDGFTLYEEYRGWVVNAERVEGDPERKDFFVLNLIGADARKGIDLFEKVSQLRVHSKLKGTEMSEKTRLMNGNHRDAPQRVPQHGVWVKTFDSPAKLGGPGAFTPLTKAGVSGRPGITVGIGLLTRDHPESTFNKPHNLPRFFSVLAFDRAIAHELLHSVGVEHHGEGDSAIAAKWVSPRNRRNKIGRPYFRQMAGAGETVITLLDERGHDLATQYMAEYASSREAWKQFRWDTWLEEGRAFIAARPGYQLELDTPEKWAENELENALGMMFLGEIVGETGGEHSGAQDCLMRYYFAQFYPAVGQTNTYYMVTPGTEPFGLELCRAKAGTGVNAPSHKPQPRYGGAGPNGGNCFSQICPNDAIPPRKL